MTFVVAGRQAYLRDGNGELTKAGSEVEDVWQRLPTLYPRLRLDELAVMPDHVHAILWLEDHPTERTPLGEVVRGWKAAASRAIRVRTPTFRWQSHYQDWVIRDQAGLDRIRRYIRNNLKQRL